MNSSQSRGNNSWYYSPDHGELYQVIEVQTLWSETTCRVWLSSSDSVVRIPVPRLKPLESVSARFKRAWQKCENGTIIAVASRIPKDALPKIRAQI